MRKTTSGFTIVELLIVIVVIAVLAAITIAAYNGIQNRAHDSAVKNDLAALNKKIQLYKVDNDTYPFTNGTTSDFKDVLNSLGVRISIGSYSTTRPSDGNTVSNVGYFEESDGSRFAVAARSKTNKMFYITSNDSIVREYTGSYINVWPTSTPYPTFLAQIGLASVSDDQSYFAWNSTTWRIWN